MTEKHENLCPNCKDLGEGVKAEIKGNKLAVKLAPKGEMMKQLNEELQKGNPLHLPKGMKVEITDLQMAIGADKSGDIDSAKVIVALRFHHNGRPIAMAKLDLKALQNKKESVQVNYQTLPGASAEDILAMDKVVGKLLA